MLDAIFEVNPDLVQLEVPHRLLPKNFVKTQPQGKIGFGFMVHMTNEARK